MNTVKLKVHNVPGHPANGKTVTVPADANGNPADPFWRRRLRDAQIDGCVEVVSPAKPAKQERSAK